MDKLEATKSANASNDAIVDDVAAKAYIENFALETFNRADDSQRSNKVTKQTADTFLAAVTFMDLLSIWGEVDKEITSKSKFAKYHARRILQAIKAGEDPNATNPVVEEAQQHPDDSIDAELLALETQQNGTQTGIYRSPAVESVESGGVSTRRENTFQGDTALPPMAPQQSEYQVSPIEPPEGSNSRHNSIGGGYFPTAPSAPADVEMNDDSPPDIPPPPENMDPKDFYNTAAPPPPTQPSAPSPESLGISSLARPSRPPPEQMTAQPPAIPPVRSPPAAQIQAPHAHHAFVPAPASAFSQQPAPVTAFKTDDESTMAAQKHARWAISALNFEDVNTAVKELRLALQSLGAG